MNVIEFPPASSKIEPTLKPKREYHGCQCHLFFIDDHSRMVQCRHCGRVVEPYDFLMKHAINQNNTVLDIEHLKDFRELLKREISELKREKKNLEAQIKRREAQLVR